MQIRLGVASWLGISFIVLKLCGVISWSWLWVLAPFWIPLAIFGIVTAGIFLLVLARKM